MRSAGGMSVKPKEVLHCRHTADMTWHTAVVLLRLRLADDGMQVMEKEHMLTYWPR